jgi:excisionase family DNA binding protein
MTQLTYTIPEACTAVRVGRTFLYQEIAAGRLRAIKSGRKTLIRADDLRQWIESLPAIGGKPARATGAA